VSPVITEISPSGRREGRFDVVVDGKRTAVLSADGIQRLAIHTGDIWTESLAALVAAEAQSLRVYDRALAMLAVRARSARELRMGLLRKREPEKLVDAAVARLLAAGALDDELFARGYVRSKMTRSGFSPRRLQAELARRGVARGIADAAIREVTEDEEIDPAALLRDLVARKLRTLTKVDAPTRRRRLHGYLARRGYGGQEIRTALELIKD
jgi:regulatory protein